MLVLTRKLGEAVVVGGAVRVTVVSIYGSRVRLGIEAPDGVNVRRMEFDLFTAPSTESTATALCAAEGA